MEVLEARRPSASNTRAPHFYAPPTTSPIVNVGCGNLSGSFLNRQCLVFFYMATIINSHERKGHHRPNPVIHIK